MPTWWTVVTSLLSSTYSIALPVVVCVYLIETRCLPALIGTTFAICVHISEGPTNPASGQPGLLVLPVTLVGSRSINVNACEPDTNQSKSWPVKPRRSRTSVLARCPLPQDAAEKVSTRRSTSLQLSRDARQAHPHPAGNVRGAGCERPGSQRSAS